MATHHVHLAVVVRNHFDTKTGLALDGKDYIAGFRGLGMDLYTVGFSLGTENRIDYTEASKVLENIASGPAYHFKAASSESLAATSGICCPRPRDLRIF